MIAFICFLFITLVYVHPVGNTNIVMNTIKQQDPNRTNVRGDREVLPLLQQEKDKENGKLGK